MSPLPVLQVSARRSGPHLFRVSPVSALAGTRRAGAARPVGGGNVHPFDGGLRHLRPAQLITPPRRKLGVT
jgi:hypothetical protein